MDEGEENNIVEDGDKEKDVIGESQQDRDNESPEPEQAEEQSESEFQILKRIFFGDFENLPSLPSKIVRIFTSSTFTDTAVERNMLMETVYPRLKEYCREQHGLEFQVVDMRWGVRDESTDDHKTAELCMQEIDNCQRLSLGPNFVVFLGQKYGYRPLPTRVLDTEFLLIVQVLEEEDGDLLKLWYKLDSNSVPNVYVLQPVSTIYKNFTNKSQKALMEEDQGKWWKTMGQLCTIIRRGAARLMESGKFSVDDNHRYNWSVTEQEVVRGVLISKDNQDHTLAFIREIKNINIKLFAHSAKFIDINFAERKVDTEAQTMLSLLRDVKVPERLTAANIIPYSIDWSDNEGINKVDHAAYLKDFSEKFYVRIVDLIERAINAQMKLCQDKMYSEILQHLHFCRNFNKLFRGRKEVLDKIRDYALSEERNEPYVIYGPSGCGKSSILARTALMSRSWMGEKSVPVLIIRFLGTTPDSSSIYPLLRTICTQISFNYDKPVENIPMELSTLTNYFKKLLESATAERPLFIFLDSLDQLSSTNSAHSLSWMPVNLPRHVKIIVSTLTGYYGILETFHNMIEIKENFCNIEQLGEELALDVIYQMLGNISRTISEKQLEIVSEVLRGCSSPLYVKLVFDQISLWKSYTENTFIAKSIEDCVSKLFERVENAHGKVLVSHALAYITASKNGLSEAELEDLISLDETVLNDIYQYHLPPIRRIPPLLWTRIRNEIPSYLSEREADGVSVVSWYHRQFIQVSSKRYLSNQKFKTYVHSQIADYFLGIWANVPKPYSYTEEQKRMFLLKSLHGEADRKVPAQPEIFFNPTDKTVRYNGRKLSELPFHLMRSGRLEELYSKVIFHYKFLFAKLSCMPLNNLIADFEDCLNSYKYDKEIILVSDALRLASSVLGVSSGNLVPQIVGRLLPYMFINSSKFQNVKSLILECESDGLRDCALVPAFNCFHSPGGSLVYSLEAHPFAVYGVCLMADGTQLLSVSNKFIIFDLSSGEVMRVINPAIEGILQSLSVSPDKKYCVSFSNLDQIVFCNVISGDVKVLPRHSMAQKIVVPPPEETKKADNKPKANDANKNKAPAKPNQNAKPAANQQNAKGNNNRNMTQKEKDKQKELERQKELEKEKERQKELEREKELLQNAEPVKEYTDTIVGSFTGLNYFVIWSKYFYYVYDKKCRVIKAEKLPFPIIQIEVVENKSIENYGVELEMLVRTEDCRDDEDKERDYFLLEYIPVLDQAKLPKKINPAPVVANKEPSNTQKNARGGKKDNRKQSNQNNSNLGAEHSNVQAVSVEAEVLKKYVPSSNKIEIHSCALLTKDKKKLFACTEIGDNTVEVFRNRAERPLQVRDKRSTETPKTVWKYHGSLDSNLEPIMTLVLSEDESYMLAVVSWGFKVYYLLTGQSKPLRFPQGVKNIQIGYKKLSFPAVFSKENKYVVAGVRDNIYIWDTSYGQFIKTLDAHYGRINSLVGSFKDQKNLVLSCSMDKSIKIWNLNNILEEDFPIDHLEKSIDALHVSIFSQIILAQSRNQLTVISMKDGKIKNQLCHNPHGGIFSCSAMSTTGSFVCSSESNRLIIWDMEEKRPTFVCPTMASTINIKQLQLHQSEVNLLCARLDTSTKNVTITNYAMPDGEAIYTIEYSLKAGTDYRNFVVSTDDTYLVVFRNDKKNDYLAIHQAIDGNHLHNVKLQYGGYMDFTYMVPMHKNPHYIGIIDAEKGTLINIKDKKTVRSVQRWNGRATKDDKHGLYAPTRGGMEVLDLKNGSRVKVLIPKVAEGVFDVDTIITPNDRHVIYYHSGRRTIRVFRLEDGAKIADYKSTARVKCMVATQDSKGVVIGCEDGTVTMMIIADPEMEEYVSYLREWRAVQLTMFGREGASSPTPQQEPPSNGTVFFKSLNVFTQLFDSVGNAPDPDPEEEETPADQGASTEGAAATSNETAPDQSANKPAEQEKKEEPVKVVEKVEELKKEEVKNEPVNVEETKKPEQVPDESIQKLDKKEEPTQVREPSGSSLKDESKSNKQVTVANHDDDEDVVIPDRVKSGIKESSRPQSNESAFRRRLSSATKHIQPVADAASHQDQDQIKNPSSRPQSRRSLESPLERTKSSNDENQPPRSARSSAKDRK